MSKRSGDIEAVYGVALGLITLLYAFLSLKYGFRLRLLGFYVGFLADRSIRERDLKDNVFTGLGLAAIVMRLDLKYGISVQFSYFAYVIGFLSVIGIVTGAVKEFETGKLARTALVLAVLALGLVLGSLHTVTVNEVPYGYYSYAQGLVSYSTLNTTGDVISSGQYIAPGVRKNGTIKRERSYAGSEIRRVDRVLIPIIVVLDSRRIEYSPGKRVVEIVSFTIYANYSNYNGTVSGAVVGVYKTPPSVPPTDEIADVTVNVPTENGTIEFELDYKKTFDLNLGGYVFLYLKLGIVANSFSITFYGKTYKLTETVVSPAIGLIASALLTGSVLVLAREE